MGTDRHAYSLKSWNSLEEGVVVGRKCTESELTSLFDWLGHCTWETTDNVEVTSVAVSQK